MRSAVDCQHPAVVRELVDVVIGLHDRFGALLTLREILETVQSCQRDLDVATRDGMPELISRLAAQRLSTMVARPSAAA
ncbi:MAG: hypothetical protein LLG14_01755 [Nocardiaceae bacterium]|nr:hypothetical protein [Nocardiaceae bacterium]